MDRSENWTFCILPYFCLAFMENKIQKNGLYHFMLGRIRELLGRAGFEPA